MSWKATVALAFGFAPMGLLCNVLHGRAAIDGTIVEKTTGIPVRDATVELHYSTSKAALQTETTDSSGSFHFNVTDPGEYGVDVAASGYLPYTSLSQNRLRIDEAMIQNEMAATFGTLELPRAATLSGEIRDGSTDEPIGKLTVNLLRMTWWHGQRLFRPGQVAITDSHGDFRIEQVRPGEYLLEIKQMPLAQIVPDRTSDRGKPSSSAKKYPVLFWPSGDANSVNPVLAEAGQETNLGKIPIDKAEPSQVLGRFDTANCGDSYRLAVDQRVGGSLLSRYDSDLDCGSGFTIPFLSAGHYQFQIWPYKLLVSGREFASEEVDVVQGADVDLAMKPKAASVLNGRVVCECETGKDNVLSALTVSIRANEQSRLSYRSAAKVRVDGTFDLVTVITGVAVLDITPLPQTLSIKTITYNGEPVAPDSILLAPDMPSRQITVTLSDKIAELDGSVVRNGKSLPDAYVVVAFSSMKPVNGWPQFVLVRADSDGRFRVRGLSAGDYQVAALSPAEWEQAQLPGILAAKISMAMRITVREAETQSIQIE